MSEKVWTPFDRTPAFNRFWCWISGGHEWRYHLWEPLRRCRGCGTKQVKVPRSISISVDVFTRDEPDQ